MNIIFDEDELKRLLEEREHLRKQVEHLQERGTVLLLENRELRKLELDAHVRAFHVKYGHPAPRELTIPDEKTIRFRFKIVSEEFLEMVEAAFKQSVQRPWALKQIREKITWLIETAPVDVDLPAFMDATHDLDYVVAGTRVVFGYDGVYGAAEVHRANMEKGPNGPNGKPVKPANWRGPDIAGVLRAQGWDG